MKFDLVCIGGGFSGLVTACRAAELGLTAAVLEQDSAERYPCSSRFSTGVTNIMGHAILDPPEAIYEAILAGSGAKANPALAHAVADNGKRAIEWLRGQGALFIQRALQQDQPGQQVLAPPRRLQAGLDWEGRGADLLMRKLEAKLTQRGGAVLRGVKAETLIIEGGACVGVAATRKDETLRLETRAVAIADGGFAANPDLIARWITQRADRVLARVGPGARGDGIVMAERAGAALGGFGEFYGHLHHRAAMANEKLWPYPHLDAAAEIGILIGPDGKRFTDEGRGGVVMANAIAQLPDPWSAHLVIDQAIWEAEPKLSTTVPANPSMVSAGGALLSARDLTGLAAQMDVPAAALQAAVAAHNEAVARQDFAALTPSRTVKKHKPLAIATPPFHAVPLCAGITGTMGGVVIDANAQAQKSAGGPFPGLYAVGTPVAGLEGGPRAGYVGGLSKAFILGLLAAEHIASQK